MKVLVCGSRIWTNKEVIFEKLDSFHTYLKITQVISGGAIGADSIGEEWAKKNNVPVRRFIPDWNLFGKSAGYKRNIQMLLIGKPDRVMAFVKGESKGTMHTVRAAQKINIPYVVVKEGT